MAQKKKQSPVPVRFVQACLNGHISDIDWYRFVNPDCRSNCPAQLWLDEGGTGNDFADIFIRCEQCKKRRPLSDATIPGRNVLRYCQGQRPWLGQGALEQCIARDKDLPEKNRLLVRSASNAYFAQTLSVISIPDSDQKLKDAVSQVYENHLKFSKSFDRLREERERPNVANALEGFTDEAVWAEVQRRLSGEQPKAKSIKQVEIEALLSSPEEVGEDIPEGDFYARTRKIKDLPSALASRLERIILVHRLREVIAQVGFTRFEAEMPDIDGELSLDVRRAALDVEPTWVPAVENKGEGVLISFNKTAIKEWQNSQPVKNRGSELLHGFGQWCKRRSIPKDKAHFPGLPYIMLHSLSHLLITAVSLECGYAASSIRERIYAGESGYGILLYTGTSGSEGTLGGLVEVGKRIEHHLATAIEFGKLCSNDPVCAQHKPDNMQEERFLHGAACHSCLLIAETSCERRNEFLDRALVVNTVEGLGAAFFPDK
ncbi:MAG: DrmB family protein [Coleofasciculaceae cyanobacterium]